MEKKIVDQKEYLKKYLASGGTDDKKKKKKKKMKMGARTVKVIDDDIDLKNMRPLAENEFDIFIDVEDAPQIAGVVDERGPVDFTDKRRWKIIANEDDGDLTITSVEKENKQSKQVRNVSDKNLSLPRKQKKYSDDNLSPPRVSKKHRSETHKKKERDEDSDLSPPRLKSKKHNSKHKTPESDSDNDSSQEIDIPHHKNKKKPKRKEQVSDDSDLSPPRRTKNYDSDLSPPRKSKKHKSHKIKPKDKNDSDLSPPRKSRKDMDSDMSPLRKNRKDSDSDASPPRIRKDKNYDSDNSPPRKNKKHKHRRRDSDSDLSPHRRKTRHNDVGPLRQHKHRDEKVERSRSHKYSEKNSRPDRKYYDSDMSPPRKGNRDVDTNLSRYEGDDRDFYKSKTNKYTNKYDYDSKHQSHREDFSKSRHRDNDEEDNEKRMKKTLDGKTAGLQNAKALREETEAYKKREAEHFSKLSKDVTGVGQATIVRNTKTGKRRNLEQEAAEDREKQKRQAEMDEKYAKWGRGLKQVEDREERLKDDLYEMSKPLARYADDVDLDKRLREQDREGDPMLEYIKQKQIKQMVYLDKPAYEGSFMPNRFGVKPGHRWDGVDRSNGYEKRWFEAQNVKVARQEEAYKWSTSDM
ncbi:BUD13 like protein [Habropoda laboriosa]|uniref:BUD13 homolog n=1 Tax=Habropoda laboriosa TaxID=597456 RepID=A0A0L7R8Z6_9HYME|nr:BUD13 like protein [Habropoda laboriosa]